MKYKQPCRGFELLFFNFVSYNGNPYTKFAQYTVAYNRFSKIPICTLIWCWETGLLSHLWVLWLCNTETLVEETALFWQEVAIIIYIGINIARSVHMFIFMRWYCKSIVSKSDTKEAIMSWGRHVVSEVRVDVMGTGFTIIFSSSAKLIDCLGDSPSTSKWMCMWY